MKIELLKNGQKFVYRVIFHMQKCSMFGELDKYTWTDVEVIGFENGKFEVKILRSNKIKRIGRLSLQFYLEDPVKFEQRVELCKQRQRMQMMN
ncbi:unnamed protein product [Paramecium octaurelia]|uniref:Uncharacterized protein n=1 Tax=Paramecium octaurelia TaxID=43137 RepID=A0A8S1Y6N0_PAROT|nr:unnamed protein product [Paramecium octaurelia]